MNLLLYCFAMRYRNKRKIKIYRDVRTNIYAKQMIEIRARYVMSLVRDLVQDENSMKQYGMVTQN